MQLSVQHKPGVILLRCAGDAEKDADGSKGGQCFWSHGRFFQVNGILFFGTSRRAAAFPQK
ncbi:hypothetical protein DDZ15_03165 [Rhodohalobacter mucosus]|uniref:Uncharacterized protein n=1 Tax=Rhodohalobacter mucosus TaxID=2079485 RepID=A0A316TUE1_9BACT|nr:hypothetical protein DDZ15_03165 [Rhodohalobacter mucosus]